MKSQRPATNLQLNISAPVGRSFVPLLHRLIPRAAALLKSPLRELSIIFLNDAAMADLHGQFMADPTTTDVMTFPIELERSGERAVSGEVYVCIPEARRQAKARGTPVEREVLLYALHGVLHLCGFDDRTEQDYRRMHRREDQILTELGVGPVFAPPPAAITPARRAPLRRRRRQRPRSRP
jgi:probable rRNA maturation factor